MRSSCHPCLPWSSPPFVQRAGSCAGCRECAIQKVQRIVRLFGPSLISGRWNKPSSLRSTRTCCLCYQAQTRCCSVAMLHSMTNACKSLRSWRMRGHDSIPARCCSSRGSARSPACCAARRSPYIGARWMHAITWAISRCSTPSSMARLSSCRPSSRSHGHGMACRPIRAAHFALRRLSIATSVEKAGCRLPRHCVGHLCT